MRSKSVSLILIFTSFALISAEEATVLQDVKNFGVIDSLLKNLEDEQWDHGESACLQATTALLNGVKNQTLWATWIWNTMQQPVGTFYGSMYHLGNFDQCLQVPWSSSHPGLRMQYCLVDVKLTKLRKYNEELTNPYDKAERYLSMESLRGRRFNTLFLGVCLPTTCKPRSIAKISRHLYRMSHLPLEDIEVDTRDCQVSGQKLEKATEFYVFWWIIGAMISICILGYFMRNTQGNTNVSQILHCFCLTRNFNALTAVQMDEIKMMHGMRALTCSILTVMHVYFTVSFAVINNLDVEKDLTSKYGRLLKHLDTLVDTFFVMSGLLHMKGLISCRSSKPLKVLCKRYFRLVVPTFALTVMCFAYVLPHLGSGPAWPRLVRKICEPCAKSWWKNLLMIGNKVDGREYCLDVSWYIHCDYQLAVMGTAIFMLYRWNKRGGFMMFSVAFIMSLIIPTIVSYRNELPGLIWYDFRECFDMIYNKVYGTVYIDSYNRANSYLVGAAMGYLMTVYRPQDYRKTISKAYSTTGFVIGFSLIVLVLHIGANSFDRQYSALITAIFATIDRVIWAVGICIIIAVCEYGTLPIINDFLSSKVFVPLSKLSYTQYLCHTMFIYRNMYSMRAPMSYDIYLLITNSLGYVAVCNIFGYFFWLFVEAPATNLINLWSDNRSTETQNFDKVENKRTDGVKSEKIL